MGRKKTRLFTWKEWNDADTIDRLYMHLMEPERFVLSDMEQRRLDELYKIWAIMCNTPSKLERIRLLRQISDLSEATWVRYMKEAGYLFGDVLAVQQELELPLAYERLMNLHALALKADDLDTARRCQVDALAVLDKIAKTQAPKTKTYTAIEFTSDPQALRARNADAEDVDFEDLTNGQQESVLEPQAIGVSTAD